MKRKEIFKMLFWAFLFSLVLIIGMWMHLGGRLTTRPINSAFFDDINPIRRERMIESGGVVTVRVTDLSEYKWGGVRCTLLDRSDVDVHVYLSEKDAAKIDLGNIITVGGRVNYVAGDIAHKHGLFIGSAIAFPPFSFPARLKTIQHKEC